MAKRASKVVKAWAFVADGVTLWCPTIRERRDWFNENDRGKNLMDVFGGDIVQVEIRVVQPRRKGKVRR